MFPNGRSAEGIFYWIAIYLCRGRNNECVTLNIGVPVPSVELKIGTKNSPKTTNIQGRELASKYSLIEWHTICSHLDWMYESLERTTTRRSIRSLKQIFVRYSSIKHLQLVSQLDSTRLSNIFSSAMALNMHKHITYAKLLPSTHVEHIKLPFNKHTFLRNKGWLRLESL